MMDARHAAYRQMLGTEDRGDGLIGVILSSFGLIPRPRGRKRLPGGHFKRHVCSVCVNESQG